MINHVITWISILITNGINLARHILVFESERNSRHVADDIIKLTLHLSITMSHERLYVSNHRRLDLVFNS